MSAISLRPIVITTTPSHAYSSVGASGDVSVPVFTTTIWANSSDHTQAFGTSQSGYWQWYYNLFPQFTLPACAFYFVAYSGTVQSGSIQMDLELLDAASTVLTAASLLVNYTVDLTTFAGFTYNVAAAAPTIGIEKIDMWNAVRVRSTCSNTNLSQLLYYGPLGGTSTPSAFVGYAAPNILVDRYN